MTAVGSPVVSRQRQARRETYGLLAELLSFPTPGLAEALAAGTVSASVEGLARSLPYRLLPPAGLAAALQPSELEPEYIRLFDLPGGGSPCPLYTGVYSPARRDAMEELLRFYRFFGLTMAQRGHDLPDAVPTVIEFQQFLVLREEAAGSSESRKAQRDILRRHLLPWASATHQRLPKRDPGPWYEAIVAFAAHFFAADLAYLDRLVARESAAQPVDHPVRV